MGLPLPTKQVGPRPIRRLKADPALRPIQRMPELDPKQISVAINTRHNRYFENGVFWTWSYKIITEDPDGL